MKMTMMASFGPSEKRRHIGDLVAVIGPRPRRFHFLTDLAARSAI
jgi:hypothetical protein